MAAAAHRPSAPEAFRPAQFVRRFRDVGQDGVNLASLAAGDHAGCEGNQFGFWAAAARRKLGCEFLVNRDVVERAKIVLQILEVFLVAGQSLRASVAGIKRFEKIQRVAQFFYCDTQLVTRVGVYFTGFLGLPSRLAGSPLE